MISIGRCIVVVLALVMCLVGSVLADDAGRETAVTSLGVGARALGMGGGFASLADDATAIHYNPAGLSRLAHQQFGFTHAVLFEGTHYNFASWVYPIDEIQGVGGGVARIGTDDIIRRVDFVDQGRFEYSFTQMMLAYGRDFGELISLGAAMKIVHQSMDNNSDFAVGVDLGLSATVYRNLSLGLVAHELARPELRLGVEKERLPRSVSGGLSVRDLALSPHARVTAAIEVEKSNGRDAALLTGAELDLHRVLALRVGYNRDNLAVGAGIRHGRMTFDYGLKLVDWVSDIHQFTVSINVGPSMQERIRRRQQAMLPPEPTEEEKRMRALIDTANRFFHRFQLDSARYYFEEALAMDPGNEEIVGTLAALEEARRVQEQREAALREAREDVSQTLSSFVAQADQLLDRGMYSAALDLLDLIFDIDPANDMASELRNEIIFARASEIASSLDSARAAVEDNRWLDAIGFYNRVLELDPDNASALNGKQQVLATMDLPERIRLGIELFEKGDLEEARKRFEAILEVNPNEPVAREYLRRITEARQEVTEKPTTTLEDLQKDREYWDLYLDGLRHMRNKDYQKAIEAWEKVLEAYPNNQATINNIEQARLRLNAQESGN